MLQGWRCWWSRSTRSPAKWHWSHSEPPSASCSRWGANVPRPGNCPICLWLQQPAQILWLNQYGWWKRRDYEASSLSFLFLLKLVYALHRSSSVRMLPAIKRRLSQPQIDTPHHLSPSRLWIQTSIGHFHIQQIQFCFFQNTNIQIPVIKYNCEK